jgi:hypothetical protein
MSRVVSRSTRESHAGLVPVISEALGCAPDLVANVGVIYPTGNVAALAAALDEACGIAGSDAFLSAPRDFLSSYSMQAAAAAYEKA